MHYVMLVKLECYFLYRQSTCVRGTANDNEYDFDDIDLVMIFRE